MNDDDGGGVIGMNIMSFLCLMNVCRILWALMVTLTRFVGISEVENQRRGKSRFSCRD